MTSSTDQTDRVYPRCFAASATAAARRGAKTIAVAETYAAGAQAREGQDC